MKINLIADKLTVSSLEYCDIQLSHIKCGLWGNFFQHHNYDFLLVESAWNGYKNRWKFKIASYPDHPKRTNKKLVHLVKGKKILDKEFVNNLEGLDRKVHFDFLWRIYLLCKAVDLNWLDSLLELEFDIFE